MSFLTRLLVRNGRVSFPKFAALIILVAGIVGLFVEMTFNRKASPEAWSFLGLSLGALIAGAGSHLLNGKTSDTTKDSDKG